MFSCRGSLFEGNDPVWLSAVNDANARAAEMKRLCNARFVLPRRSHRRVYHEGNRDGQIPICVNYVERHCEIVLSIVGAAQVRRYGLRQND